MEPRDLEQVGVLLRRYLERFKVAAVYEDEELAHWLLSGKGEGEKVNGKRNKQVTWAYVVEVRGLISLYQRFGFLKYLAP